MAFRYLFVAAVFAFLPSSAAGIAFSNIFVFGDSLSDTGNVTAVTGGLIPGAPYFQGRASNGPLYVDVLAAGLGLSLTPSRVDTTGDGIGDGNNFAYGGARTNIYPFPFDGRSLLGQLQEFQARGQPIDPSALFVVFGGANNVQDALRTAAQALAAGQNPSIVLAAAAAAIDQGAADIETILTMLGDLGATQFLIPNLPNVGPRSANKRARQPGSAAARFAAGHRLQRGIRPVPSRVRRYS